MCKNRKGFTLIELLIVITIIGILAVAFLPTLLGAPAKGRDTQRIADLQKLQKVLVNADLEGTSYPASACVDDSSFATYLSALGGKAPTPPTTTDVVTGPTGAPGACTGKYLYVKDPAPTTSKFKFGLYAKVESFKNSNMDCTKIATAGGTLAPATDGTAATYCYAILTQ